MDRIQKREFRTLPMNFVFAQISEISQKLKQKNSGTKDDFSKRSASVVPAGETSNFFDDLARCQAALKTLRTSAVFELLDPKKAVEI